jgi:hypothetical protein
MWRAPWYPAVGLGYSGVAVTARLLCRSATLSAFLNFVFLARMR